MKAPTPKTEDAGLPWVKVGTWAAVIAVPVAIVAIAVSHFDSRHEDKPPAPTIVNTPTVTASGGSSATVPSANGQGSHIGSGDTANSNNKSNSVTMGGAPPPVVPPGDELEGTRTTDITPGHVHIAEKWHISPKAKPISATPQEMAHINFFFDLGKLDIKQERYKAAVTANTQVLALSPQDAGAYNNRAIGRYNSGDYADAISDWKSAIGMDPVNLNYHSNLAMALSRYAVGRKDGGLLATQAIQEDRIGLNDPENTPKTRAALWEDMAGGYTQIGSTRDALEAAQEAIKYDPTAPIAHTVYAQVLLAYHREAQALDELHLAIKLNPNVAGPYWILAEYYAFLRPDRDKVYLNLTKALAVDPSIAVNFKNPHMPWARLCDEPRFKKLIMPATGSG